MSLNHGHEHDGPQPTVYVLRRELDLDGRHHGDALQHAVAKFAKDFCAGLAAAGCTLIGHVKGAIEDADGGVLYFNTTGFTAAPMLRGRLDGAPTRLTLNAIVFGIAEGDVERAALQALARHLDGDGDRCRGNAPGADRA